MGDPKLECLLWSECYVWCVRFCGNRLFRNCQYRSFFFIWKLMHFDWTLYFFFHVTSVGCCGLMLPEWKVFLLRFEPHFWLDRNHPKEWWLYRLFTCYVRIYRWNACIYHNKPHYLQSREWNENIFRTSQLHSPRESGSSWCEMFSQFRNWWS